MVEVAMRRVVVVDIVLRLLKMREPHMKPWVSEVVSHKRKCYRQRR